MWVGNMRGYVLALGISLAWQPFAHAGQEGISMVRQAAIERLQSKLGGLRGTLKPGAERVFLTEEMIEQLKPIKVVQRERLKDVTQSGTQSGFVTAAGGEKIALSEIYGVAGLPQNESRSSTASYGEADYDMGTTAGVAGQSARMDDILKLAEELASGQ